MLGETFPCPRHECFGCVGGRCHVLTPPGHGGAGCPFYATRAEHFDGCARAYRALKERENGEDYIERYAKAIRRNGPGSMEDEEQCNLAYLSLFAMAEPGSYAASVYAEYAPRYNRERVYR